MATVKIPSPAEQRERMISQSDPVVDAAIARIVKEMERNPALRRFDLFAREAEFGQWIANRFREAGWEATFSTDQMERHHWIALKTPHGRLVDVIRDVEEGRR